MRPARFTEFVIDVAQRQGVRAQTLAEAGDTQHPYGVVLSVGRGARWQFVGQLPEGAKHDSFTDEPVTGTPAPSGAAPTAGDEPEAWFAAALTHAECPEVAAVERWSTRPNGSTAKGVTVTFHNGARIFARAL